MSVHASAKKYKVDSNKVPNSHEKWTKVSKRFYQPWHFSNCCGALNGKHIAIEEPANCGSDYFNFKKYNIIVLMAMVDADYKFSFVEVPAYGRAFYGGVFGR